ncbi:MAG: H-X9-DG-CTERM domain-containing protein [Armatimonadota bacterium]
MWGGGAAGNSLAAIGRPAETIYGFEQKAAPCDGYYCGIAGAALALALNNNSANEPHNGGMNTFFVDGHAKWMSQFAVDGSNFTP